MNGAEQAQERTIGSAHSWLIRTPRHRSRQWRAASPRKAISRAGRSRPPSICRSRSRSRSWSKDPPGVGKTELAKAIAAWRGMKMIRLQCYEGLDEAKALYEWKYAKQLLYTQILKDKLGEVLGGAADAECRAGPAPRLRRRVLLQGVRRAAAPAPGAGAAGRLRAPDRRDRQVGRGIRIAAAGDPLRLPGHDPRARHSARRSRRRR